MYLGQIVVQDMCLETEVSGEHQMPAVWGRRHVERYRLEQLNGIWQVWMQLLGCN